MNSKLELLSNIYSGRIILVDRDFRVVKDTYGADEGKTLISPLVVKCFQGKSRSVLTAGTRHCRWQFPL